MEQFAVTIGLVSGLGAWCILRVRREYRRQSRLSPLSVFSIWALYTSHFLITTAAAATSRWPLPLNHTIAVGIGIFLIGLGGFLFLAGIVSFGSLRRMSGIDSSKLVTTGAYRWSRNPQNVGWALFLCGVALVGRSGLAVLMTALFWATFRAYLVAEEEFLERIFGAEYRRYRNSSHRYFGPPRRSTG